MVQLGLIEIKLSNGSVVNASNVDTLRNVDKSEYFMFSLIKKPQGINIPLVRRVTNRLSDKTFPTNLILPTLLPLYRIRHANWRHKLPLSKVV